MVYQQCGPIRPQVCGAPPVCYSGCAEGCFCPCGKVDNGNGTCIDNETCPSKLHVIRICICIYTYNNNNNNNNNNLCTFTLIARM